jgi:hypothetical protein
MNSIKELAEGAGNMVAWDREGYGGRVYEKKGSEH